MWMLQFWKKFHFNLLMCCSDCGCGAILSALIGNCWTVVGCWAPKWLLLWHIHVLRPYLVLCYSEYFMCWKEEKIAFSKSSLFSGDLMVQSLSSQFHDPTNCRRDFLYKMSDLKVWAVSVSYQGEVIKPSLFGNNSIKSPKAPKSHRDEIYFPATK